MTERDEEVVRICDVSKTYGRGHAATQTLAGLSFIVAQGEFVSVMGPSGCGKSTLLNLLAGYDRPTSGTVFVAGRNLWDMNERGRSDLRARHLGFVVQNFDLLPRLTAEENVLVRLGPLQVRRQEARRRTASILEKVGIPPQAWARYPSELSGGEQQRVAMARALVADPQLLLADEPTGNLDSINGARILDLLRDLNAERKMSVVMVTHDTFASTYGHRTMTMKDGRIAHDVGSLAEARGVAVARLVGGTSSRPPARNETP